MRPTLSRFPYSFPGGRTDPNLKRIPAAEMLSREPSKAKARSRSHKQARSQSHPNNNVTIMGVCRAGDLTTSNNLDVRGRFSLILIGSVEGEGGGRE